MKTNWRISILGTAFILMLSVMFILPFFSTQEYFMKADTLYQLGSQSSSFAWIMNGTFILLATGSVLAGWSHFESFLFHRIVLVLYGISLSLSAIFNPTPIVDLIPFNIAESGLHEYFAGTATFSFIILSISSGFTCERQSDRMLAVATGVSAIILSVLTSESDHLSGIWHRMLILISSGWMVYTFKSTEY